MVDFLIVISAMANFKIKTQDPFSYLEKQIFLFRVIF